MTAMFSASTVLVGEGVSPVVCEPIMACVWVGSCWMFTVTEVLPAASPSVCPLPMWVGTRPRRLGRAKVVWPLPPYVVPRRANSAWFWLIGRNWPLHNAHPLGGKLNETSLISDRKGSDIHRLLTWGGEVGRGRLQAPTREGTAFR